MKISVLIFILAVSSLIGCSGSADNELSNPIIERTTKTYTSHCTGRFEVSPFASQQQQDEVMDAAARWNTVLGFTYFQIGSGCIITFESAGHDGLVYESHGYQVKVYPEYFTKYHRPTELTLAMMHMMGESLGMNKMGPGHIMSANANEMSVDFTLEDMEECRRVGFCQ